MSDYPLTSIDTLGEFGLIDLLTRDFQNKNSSTVLGVGDDAAEVNMMNNSVLISTDMMVENIHFDLHYFPLKYLGFKLVSISSSDIYAMGAEPSQLLVSLACSNIFSAEALQELYQGIHEACEHYGIDLIGGDTTASHKGLILNATVLGETPEGQGLLRSGAQEGDLICVSGDLGAAYMGLLLLEREKEVRIANPNEKPQWQNAEWILQKFLKPLARKDVIEWIQKEKLKVHSMIDLSDGLSSELLHFCQQSNLGCEIYEDKLPFHPQTKEMAMTFQIPSSTAALSGGEDYELLFTIPQSEYKKVEDLDEISVIGHMVADTQKRIMHSTGGQEIELTAQGWKHF